MANTNNNAKSEQIHKNGIGVFDIDKGLLQAAVQFLPEGFGIYNKEGVLQYGNDVFGYIVNLCHRKYRCNVLESPDFPKNLLERIMEDKPCEAIIYFNDEGDIIKRWHQGCVTVRTRVTPVEYNGSKSEYFVIVSENISKQEDVNHRIAYLNRQHQLVLRNINSGLVYMKPDYTVIAKNKLSMYGNEEENMYRIGSRCYEHFGKSEPCEVCPVVQAHEDLQPKFRTFHDPIGQVLDVSAVPVRNDDNEVDGYLLKLDDVTERENLIKQLRKAIVKAEESEKMKSSFLASMSHEIRTPLNSIVGFIQLLSDPSANLMSIDEKSKMGGLAKYYVGVLMTIVDDIFDLSKFESGKYTPEISDITLSDICRASLESVRDKLPAGVELNLDIPKKYMSLVSRTDAKKLMRLLGNYLSNACKHTTVGSITLGFRLENTIGGAMVHFEVNDTGEGVPKDKAKEIFDPFRKLDEFKQGTGLGLHICRLIADMLHGAVYLNEDYSKGASFVFDMPLVYVE